jgi:hypothetical protein
MCGGGGAAGDENGLKYAPRGLLFSSCLGVVELCDAMACHEPFGVEPACVAAGIREECEPCRVIRPSGFCEDAEIMKHVYAAKTTPTMIKMTMMITLVDGRSAPGRATICNPEKADVSDAHDILACFSCACAAADPLGGTAPRPTPGATTALACRSEASSAHSNATGTGLSPEPLCKQDWSPPAAASLWSQLLTSFATVAGTAGAQRTSAKAEELHAVSKSNNPRAGICFHF